MKKNDTTKFDRTARWRRHRRDRPSLRWVCLLLLILVANPVAGQAGSAAAPDPQLASARALVLADIQLSGGTRTPLSTVYRFVPLRRGQSIDQAMLVAAVAELRASNLFRTVSFYTRPATQRGQLILVLEVVEHGLDFRWAAGNTDLDGWYLVPAMVAYDNPLGRGGFLDLQLRIGFRHSGTLLRYSQPRAGDGRNFWTTQLSGITTDRPYFTDGVEFRHEVRTGGLATVWGRRFTAHQRVEIGLNFQNVTVADHSVAQTKSQDESIGFGQVIPEEDLPEAIRNVVGQEKQTIAHLAWQHDTRATELRAGSPVSGAWGRLKGQYTFQEKREGHAGLQADLRVYHKAPGGVLAARVRGAWVGKQAAFYDRLYLGGMYSVRGFPTHALSAPGGDTWLWSSSLEYRSRILGDAKGTKKGTKLAGVLFVDAGASGSDDMDDPYSGVAAGAGYGLRLRVWWLDWIGLDVGFPLTERPLDMRFQVSASIGLTY